jgi:hypothetical protein
VSGSVSSSDSVSLSTLIFESGVRSGGFAESGCGSGSLDCKEGHQLFLERLHFFVFAADVLVFRL